MAVFGGFQPDHNDMSDMMFGRLTVARLNLSSCVFPLCASPRQNIPRGVVQPFLVMLKEAQYSQFGKACFSRATSDRQLPGSYPSAVAK
jgi:hypothetical protein